MRVSGVAKAFGATFVDIEGLTFVGSLGYRKGGHLYVYLKEGEFEDEKVLDEVQREIDQVFEAILRLGSGDVRLKDRRVGEYRFVVLNEGNVKKALARISRRFKSKH